MGTTGCTLLFLVFAPVGASLFFGFSWLHVAERVGLFIEKALRRLIELKAAREDRKVGQTKQAERDEIVVAKQVQLVHEQPVRIEPAITSVPKRSEEHTSELQSLMRISYAVFCLKKKKKHTTQKTKHNIHNKEQNKPNTQD